MTDNYAHYMLLAIWHAGVCYRLAIAGDVDAAALHARLVDGYRATADYFLTGVRQWAI